MSAGYCDGCGGRAAAAGCPLCDPRPTSADRAAGCICADGDVPIERWKPIVGCPVHLSRRELVLDLPDELEPVLAALYGPAWRTALLEHLTEQLADQLAGEQTPDPARHPSQPSHGEDAVKRPVDAGGRVGPAG